MNQRSEVETIEGIIESESFDMAFQPQVSVETGRIAGYEALIRWPPGKEGYMSPPEIISAAKELGHLQRMGEWILRKALRTNLSIQKSRSGSPLFVSVNISPDQFLEDPGGFVTLLETVLDETGHPPRALELEITEEAAVRNFSGTKTLFSSISDMGVSLAIDDFGTGYSSLNYLTRMPFDTLKIDREFISGIEKEERKEKLVDAIIAIGNALDMSVIAEGVDTMEQLAYIQDRGCKLYQGYLYCHPLAEEELEKILHQPT